MHNGPNILFFGRKNDKYSIECVEHLNSLGFNVKNIWSSKRGEKIPQSLDYTGIDYIFSFRSYFILPKSLLKTTKYYSINFHPGPPEYPGAGMNFAIYENRERYGVTIHLMNEKIDDGAIIDVSYFSISDDENIENLLKKTHEKLLIIFKEFTTSLSKYGEKFVLNKLDINKDMTWGKKKWTSKDLNKFQVLDINIDKNELNRIIRSFNYPGFPIELEFHGHRFTLKNSKDY